MKILLLSSCDQKNPLGKGEMVGRYLEERGHDVWRLNGKADNETQGWFQDVDLAISYFYRHILKPEQFNAPKFGALNVHPSFLPYNRGAMPNVWAIIDEIPAGATIHWIDEGVDTGPIIARKEESILSTDTGETLYNRLIELCYNLFVDTWSWLEPALLVGQRPSGLEQPWGVPPYKKDDVKRIDNVSGYRKVIDILRARTFDGHESAYFIDGSGEKIEVRVWLRKA